MDEQTWLNSSNAIAMLRFLGEKASPGKLRLFSCACVRLFPAPEDIRSRRAIEFAERYSDGKVTKRELRFAWADAKAARQQVGGHLSMKAADAARPDAMRAARRNCSKENPRHASLLRDIFGNPFRSATADQSWFAWNDGTVRKMAEAIYHERAFDRMPVLADALEEAGCGNADILSHCRSEAEHTRGCWVVDLARDTESNTATKERMTKKATLVIKSLEHAWELLDEERQRWLMDWDEFLRCSTVERSPILDQVTLWLEANGHLKPEDETRQ